MSILEYRQVHLVGIKGVAMTSLAQLLSDAHIKITGTDVAEKFVTTAQLEKLDCQIAVGFDQPLPEGTELVVFTAAHRGKFNSQVVIAQEQGIPTLSQAEALADLANQKKGIAVCGVGGKSTTSAMLAWIFEKMQLDPSYSVGVGAIPGLNRTGKWSKAGEFFITEADEYVTDPSAPSRGESITPRFSYLHPYLTVCTRISFDHPDVYKDFEHTLATFQTFFQQINPDGYLIFHSSQKNLGLKTSASHQVTYGKEDADVTFAPLLVPGENRATITIGANVFELELSIPGEHNLENATAALAVCHALNLDVAQASEHLKSFQSTQRRFEYRGNHNGVTYYDDYAHHPREISAAIQAFNEWLPDYQRIIVFQPHTFSRTKQLFSEFVDSFAAAETIVLLDIFASARESADDSISSDLLVAALKEKYPEKNITNLRTVDNLANFCKSLPAQTGVLTLGAGDIYAVHDTIGA